MAKEATLQVHMDAEYTWRFSDNMLLLSSSMLHHRRYRHHTFVKKYGRVCKSQ